MIASVEIRDTGITKFPAAVEDVKCAILFMRKHAGEYGIDLNRVAVWGDSSGGHLSLMTGLTIGEYDNGLYSEQTDEVSAIIDYYGVSDLLTLGKYNDILDHDAADSPFNGIESVRNTLSYNEEGKQVWKLSLLERLEAQTGLADILLYFIQ
ncbi:esterase/lipase [Paenibacillus riograndensis SBR5]|uniref:Esterase/lipase n=1 Tax=Paenibacillus riograndensis SBR5 TaxID=1073571 RepID=A0A0E4HDK2_9BACL|nr:alpha/beta hydrolase [Paenibacillus riograndensis]CQR57372.1 esterase/lipase [Paenibacillus riograndensis SBR5]